LFLTFAVSEVQIFCRGEEVVVLKKRSRNLTRAFELLTELFDDHMENGREQPPAQQREAF